MHISISLHFFDYALFHYLYKISIISQNTLWLCVYINDSILVPTYFNEAIIWFLIVNFHCIFLTLYILLHYLNKISLLSLIVHCDYVYIKMNIFILWQNNNVSFNNKLSLYFFDYVLLHYLYITSLLSLIIYLCDYVYM